MDTSASQRRLAIATVLATCIVGLVAPEAQASKSQSLSTRISLPNGPGSIAGLGGEFKPSMASGTASYEVPIVVPPAAAGFVPSLAMAYDSGGGASDLGLGWNLSGVPRIRRRTENGLPRFDKTDAFEVAGLGIASDLLEISPNIFRPQYESGAFLRVQRSADGATWEVRDKGGVTFRFGGEGFTEGEEGKVGTWLLREQRDLFGHVIKYTWRTVEGHALLDRVTYNDSSPEVRSEVAFGYEDRPDPLTRYSNGFKERLTQRLKRIEVNYGGRLVRRYDLGYAPGAHSRLAQVVQVGTDGTTAMPTLTLAYTEPKLAVDTTSLVTMTTPPGRSPLDPNIELADLNGDGTADLLVSSAGKFSSYINNAGQSWTRLDWTDSASPSLELGALGVQLADVDGDGAVDLLAKSPGYFRMLPGKDAQTFGPALTITPALSVSFEDPDVRLADMDGDRRTDVVLTTTAGLAIAYNEGGARFAEPVVIGTIDPKQPLRFSDGHTQLCDVNGDRVLDLCYLRSGSLVYYLGRGRGRFEPAVSATNVPTFDPSAPFQLQDLDGDGRIDLVRVGVTQVEYALASGEGVFDAVKAISGTPYKGPDTTVRFADMNGSGTTDIVWINVAGSPDKAWQYLEVFPAGRAGLLAQVDNGLGKKVSVTYSPAAEDAAAARAATKPWASRMNVGMPVVRRTAVESGIGDPPLVTEYSYGEGTYSPVERTFAGFGVGIEKDVGDTFTPSLLSENAYDVGLVDRTQRGALLLSTTKDETGKVFHRVTTAYALRKLDLALDGRVVTYSHKTSEKLEHIEGDTKAAKVTLTEWEQDEFGNTTAEKKWGVVDGDDKLAGNDEAITVSTFANNTTDWILGRPATTELRDGAGRRLRFAEKHYDGEAFVGLPLGKVARGLITREMSWVGPGPDKMVLSSSSAFDAHGNPIETRDARGGGRLLTYDPTGAFLLSESVKTGARILTQQASYNGAFGTIVSFTNFNGAVSTFTYDALGRVSSVVKPGDSADLPTLRYTYTFGNPLSQVTTEGRVFHGRDELRVSTDLIDGLGRPRATLSRASNGRVVFSAHALFDARGKERRTVRASWLTGKADAAALLADGPGQDTFRDALARPVRIRSQLGHEARIEHHPFETHTWDAAQNDPSTPYEHTPLVEVTDGLGRLVQTKRFLGGATLATTHTYDGAGGLLSSTNAEGHITTYQYDGLGRRTLLLDPDAGRHEFAFDAVGNLIGRKYPDGKVALFTYDLAGRLLTEDWNGDGVPEVTRVFDEGHNNELGALVRAVSPAGTVHYSHDVRGRLTKTTFDFGAAGVHVTGALYDALDREYLHVYPDGSSIRIHYDGRGLIAGYGKDALRLDYDADEKEISRTFSTGVAEWQRFDDDLRRVETLTKAPSGGLLQRLEWTLDPVGNITKVTDKRPGVTLAKDRGEVYQLDNLYRLTAAKGTWGEATWRYSASGNVLERASSVGTLHAGPMTYGAAAGPHALSSFKGRSLVYDKRGRLLDDGDRAYSWNDADQLVGVLRKSNGASTSAAFDHDGVRRLRAEDTDGTKSTTVFVDDWAEVKDGRLQRFIVHGGQRVARLAESNGAGPGIAASPIGDGAAEPPSGCSTARTPMPGPTTSKAAVARFLDPARWLLPVALLLALARRYRTRLLASLRVLLPLVLLSLTLGSGGVGCGHDAPTLPPVEEGTVLTLGVDDELLLADGIGSLTETTTGAGEAKASSAVYPFGLERFDSASELTRKFAHTARDKGVGIDQMGQRAYVPEFGVWTSVDPVVVEEPLRLVGAHPCNSAYAYGGGNPVRYVDRDGRFAVALGYAVLALAGAAVVASAAHAVGQTRVSISSSSPTISEGQAWAMTQPKPTFQVSTAAGTAPKTVAQAPPAVVPDVSFGTKKAYGVHGHHTIPMALVGVMHERGLVPGHTVKALAPTDRVATLHVSATTHYGIHANMSVFLNAKYAQHGLSMKLGTQTTKDWNAYLNMLTTHYGLTGNALKARVMSDLSDYYKTVPPIREGKGPAEPVMLKFQADRAVVHLNAPAAL